MNLTWVVGVAFVGVMGFLFLRQYVPQTAQLITFAALLLLFTALVPRLEEIVSSITTLGRQAGIDEPSLQLVLRGIGIGLITHVASAVCVDCGQRALGETVDYCGQIAIVSLALPMISELAKRISEAEF